MFNFAWAYIYQSVKRGREWSVGLIIKAVIFSKFFRRVWYSFSSKLIIIICAYITKSYKQNLLSADRIALVRFINFLNGELEFGIIWTSYLSSGPKFQSRRSRTWKMIRLTSLNDCFSFVLWIFGSSAMSIDLEWIDCLLKWIHGPNNQTTY